MANNALIFEEAYSKKAEEHFVLFSISRELPAETSSDPLSTQVALLLFHSVPGGLTLRLDFSATLTVVSKMSTLNSGPSTLEDTSLDEPERTVRNVGDSVENY